MQDLNEKQNVFFEAIEIKKKLLLTYYSGQQNLFLTILCIPIEYVPSISEEDSEFYYFWNELADVGERIFGCPPEEIKYIELIDESFNPNEYIIPNKYDLESIRNAK